MIVLREILGDAREPRFTDREVERLLVDSGDATKRRLRAVTDAGTDLAIDLEPRSFLCHGAVLADAGHRTVVVERKAEDAMVIRLSATLDPQERLRQALGLGHAIGNQHVPIEIEGDEIRVLITTSRDVVGKKIRVLGLGGAAVAFRLVRFAKVAPLKSPAHAHGEATTVDRAPAPSDTGGG